MFSNSTSSCDFSKALPISRSQFSRRRVIVVIDASDGLGEQNNPGQAITQVNVKLRAINRNRARQTEGRGMQVTDLNRLGLPVEHTTEAQRNNGISTTAKIEIIFRDHQARLVAEIRRTPIVLGCVAWLTDGVVLDALSHCDHVSIVVQKEDFLKPDLVPQRATDLRSRYARLKAGYSRYALPGGVNELSYCSDPSIDPVRCVGNHNSLKRPAWPRMHNKFLIFCEFESREGGFDSGFVRPVRVWTGSYNISYNATQSWENAVLIDDPAAAEAYAREFAQILTFSEPLDWTSDWVEPEYRIGS
jgi:hypothetical protein